MAAPPLLRPFHPTKNNDEEAGGKKNKREKQTHRQPSCLGAIKKQGKPAAGEEEKPALQEAASHRGKNMETRVSSKLFLSFPALLHLAAIFASVRRSSAASFFVIGDSSVNCGNNGFFSPILSDNDNASLFLCDATDQLLLVPDLLGTLLSSLTD
ncbi:hypothetical protein ACLOJK_000122 [Asimina triloba]